jgi:hypothetical protein
MVEVRIGRFLRHHKMLNVGKSMRRRTGQRNASLSKARFGRNSNSVALPEITARTAIEKKVWVLEKRIFCGPRIRVK